MKKKYILQLSLSLIMFSCVSSATECRQDEIVALESHVVRESISGDGFQDPSASEHQRTHDIHKLLFLILTLLPFTIAAGFYSFFRRRRESRAEKEYALVRQELNEIKENRRCDKVRFDREIHDKEEAMSKLRLEYIRIYRKQFQLFGSLCEIFLNSGKYNDSHKQVYDKVNDIVKDIGGDSKGQRHFEKMINESLDDVMAHIRDDFPSFSDADYRFVSYVIAGFDATTISVILRMPSLAAVYMKKSRLKKQFMSSLSIYRENYLEILG